MLSPTEVSTGGSRSGGGGSIFAREQAVEAMIRETQALEMFGRRQTRPGRSLVAPSLGYGSWQKLGESSAVVFDSESLRGHGSDPAGYRPSTDPRLDEDEWKELGQIVCCHPSSQYTLLRCAGPSRDETSSIKCGCYHHHLSPSGGTFSFFFFF